MRLGESALVHFNWVPRSGSSEIGFHLLEQKAEYFLNYATSALYIKVFIGTQI